MKRLIALLCFVLACPGLYAQFNTQGYISATSTNCATANSCVELTIPSNASSASITISPTYVGTNQFEVTADGSNWVAWLFNPSTVGTAVSSTTTTGTWTAPVASLTKIRVRASAYTSGRAGIFINTSSGAYSGPGTGGTFPVTGTFWQATQPVSLASAPTTAVTNADITTIAGMVGTSTCYLSSAASTNATNCKAAAGSVLSLHGTNTTAAAGYLRMYNLASAPTCSSATGFIETIPLAPADGFFGINGRTIPLGQTYSTGIGFCLTGGGSSTDDTAVGTGVYITILYK